jgi:predicted lipid-binding transport protein (Tim44 family)
MKFWSVTLALVMALACVNADAARRLGGGKSFGKQSSNVTQREAMPAGPAQGATNSVAKPAVGAAPAAAPVAPKRPWGAMLGGLAAGLGLAWLANSMGFGEGFGQIIMFALLAMGVMMTISWFLRNRRNAQTQSAGPYAFQGAATGGVQVTDVKRYRPENVGNDASARPWERSSSMAFETPGGAGASGSMIGSALSGSQTWGIPADFDSEGFLNAAKANFVTLQAAWDKSDINSLRAMMTDEMLKEIQAQLADREVHTGGPVNQTDVVMIDAKLLGIEDLGDAYMASVEFSGMIREEPSSSPSPFREVWNMSKPKSGSVGWLVAGVQALQ